MTTHEAEDALEVLSVYRAKVLDIATCTPPVTARTTTVSVRVTLAERRTLTALAAALDATLGELLRPRVEYLLREAARLGEFADTVRDTLNEEEAES